MLCAPQVIADFREDSPTFGRWCGVLLTEHNKKQVYVPPNCGHGFFTLEDNTCALYLQEVCSPQANPHLHPHPHPHPSLLQVEGAGVVLQPTLTRARARAQTRAFALTLAYNACALYL